MQPTAETYAQVVKVSGEDASRLDEGFLRFIVAATRKPDSSRIKKWLMSPPLAGTFVVRPSSSATVDLFVLSVSTADSVVEERISGDNKGVSIIDCRFGSIAELVYYFHHHEVASGATLANMATYGDRYIMQAALTLGMDKDSLVQMDQGRFHLRSTMDGNKLLQLAEEIKRSSLENCSTGASELDVLHCYKLWFGLTRTDTSV